VIDWHFVKGPISSLGPMAYLRAQERTMVAFPCHVLRGGVESRSIMGMSHTMDCRLCGAVGYTRSIVKLVRRQSADSRQQRADSRQQRADIRQPTADSRQQTADSSQQTEHTKQTADARQQTEHTKQTVFCTRRASPYTRRSCQHCGCIQCYDCMCCGGIQCYDCMCVVGDAGGGGGSSGRGRGRGVKFQMEKAVGQGESKQRVFFHLYAVMVRSHMPSSFLHCYYTFVTLSLHCCCTVVTLLLHTCTP
jgi:hypothetical protein